MGTCKEDTPLPHELHHLFPTFEGYAKDMCILETIEQIEWWKFIALSTTAWEQYQKKTPAEKASQFESWLSAQTPPTPRPRLSFKDALLRK